MPPADSLQDVRTTMVTLLERIGVAVEAHHHEVATGGQAEIDMRFAPLTRMARHAPALLAFSLNSSAPMMVEL